MESTGSSTSSQHPQLPPGFRFHPTDEELVVHYLKRKAASAPLPVTIIAEVDLYKFDPWELPSKATFGFGEQEWYFFSPRERKYPNGTRPNRAATSGYWKATGTDKPILTSNGNHKVGVKKALVFYGGKPPKGIKTNWIMHEYRLVDNNSLTKPLVPDLANKKNSSRLDDWVLCRVYKKSNAQKPMERDREDSTSYGSLFEYDEHFFEGMLPGEALKQNTCVSQLAASSSSKAANLSIVVSPSTTSTNTFPTKHAAMPPQFWNEASASGSMASSSGKRLFHGNLSSGSSATDDHNNSFVSLLNQIPQSLPFNTNNSALLGDGTTLRQQFQLPSINWNS